MAKVTEFYADKLAIMSIGNGGTIAKLVFTSSIPDSRGEMVQANALTLTMPVNQLQKMLLEIKNAGIEADQPLPQSLATGRRARAQN
jgi:hypothetical protein